MSTPIIGTLYGPNTCRRCGNPAGIYSTFDCLCPSCYRRQDFVQKITRAYVARIRPSVSPSCPYDAIEHYEADALAAYAQETDR